MGLLDQFKLAKTVNTHVADCNAVQSGWIKCTKPNGDVYGLIINSFTKRIDAGEIVVDKEDEKKGLIMFHYAGSKSPF
jgi:hypothetical protein